VTAAGQISVAKPGWIHAIRTLGRRTALLRSFVTGLIMLGIVTDVVRRTLTGRSIPGMVELVETFMALEVFLGLAHAEAEGVHVRMSLVTNLMAFRIRRLLKTFGMAVCILGSVWFAWGSTLRAIEATSVSEVKPGLLRFPVWPARWAIAFGFAVLVVEYVARVWEEWHATPPEVEGPLGLDEIIAAEAAKESRIVETLDRLNEEN
jgi:TRAP-type C4-dicarboxylate transport system permease small subunit